MLIEQIDIYHVAMPLIYPWRTAYGEDAAIESVLVKITSGDVVAWGESTPLAAPCYSPEYAAGVFETVRAWLAPRILGRDIESGEQLQEELRLFKGNSFAKAALDTAWWSAHSAVLERPLHQLLGATRDLVEVGADFGVMDSYDALLEQIGQAVDAGFARIKLKFRPGWDVEMLEAVRSQHPDHPIHIDCNSGYTLDALPLFKKLDRFRLEMIEQPLAYDDVVDHARLQAAIETPVCLDESICSLDRARKAIEHKSCQWINIKPGRVGGLTVAKQIHDLCAEAGIPCWVGGMLESSVGSHQCAALAMLDNFKYAPDLFPSSRFYTQDLGDPPLCLTTSKAGRPAVRVGERFGNAAVPDPERLQKLTVQSATLRADESQGR